MNRAAVVRRTRVDAKLLRAIRTAENSDALIEIACCLRRTVLSPSGIEAQIQELIDRAARNSRVNPTRLHTFPRMRMFLVTAWSQFIALLIHEPEIASATMIRWR